MKEKYIFHLDGKTFTAPDIQVLTKQLIKDSMAEKYIKDLEAQLEFDKNFKSCHEKGFLEAKDPKTDEDATEKLIEQLAIEIKDNLRFIEAIKKVLKTKQQT